MAASASTDDDMISGINVTPLVDITLVLLVILMVTASYVASKAIPAQDARYAVERIVRAYKGERTADMTFGEWADRQGDARLAAMIGVAVAPERDEVAA